MPFDPFAEDPVPRKGVHDIGQDLSLLSIDEIDERIGWLEKEIARLREAQTGKRRSMDAASAFFNLGSA